MSRAVKQVTVVKKSKPKGVGGTGTMKNMPTHSPDKTQAKTSFGASKLSMGTQGPDNSFAGLMKVPGYTTPSPKMGKVEKTIKRRDVSRGGK